MKKVIILVIILIALALLVIVMIGAAPARPAVGGNNSGFTEPSYAARLWAGVRTRFTDGRSELQRSLEARKNVTSFRMTTLLRLHPGHPMETTVEVSCPDRERFTTTIGEKAFHAVRIGAKAWIEQQDGTWTVQDSQPSGWAPCGDNPGEPAPWAVMNEGRDTSTVLAKMADHAEIVRGPYVGTPNGNCQQWLLTLNLPGGAAHGHGPGGLHYTVCLDPSQHLPVSVVMGSGGMVTNYSDWNKPVKIEAPEGAISK